MIKYHWICDLNVYIGAGNHRYFFDWHRLFFVLQFLQENNLVHKFVVGHKNS